MVTGFSNYFSYTQPITVTKNDLEKSATSSFQTHPVGDLVAARAHTLSHYLSLPWRASLRCLAYSIEPLPGEYKKQYKNQPLFAAAKKITSLALAITIFPAALLSLPFALPLHIYSHSCRPTLSMIHNPKVHSSKTASESLHVRTHNLGFVYEFFRVLGDLRDVKTRAHEIALWIENGIENGIENNRTLPEVIFFQEAFHIDGTQLLCDRLKEKYPYVIHSIAPHVLGLNNGAVIASKYPIQELSYRPFDNMLGPERWSTRGLLKIRIEKDQKQIDVYGTHLQALLGKSRAKVREEQMEKIVTWIQEDQNKNPSDVQVLLGDMNASKLSPWAEENHEDDACFEVMNEHFHDVFRNDHDEHGQRTIGVSRFARNDSPDKIKALQEPTGSWYIGPFADKGIGLRAKEWYERVCNGVPKKPKAKHIPSPHHWGTKEWSSVQLACSARFDYILRYKRLGSDSAEDRAEIRRVKVHAETQSAPSDHLPVDGFISISNQ